MPASLLKRRQILSTGTSIAQMRWQCQNHVRAPFLYTPVRMGAKKMTQNNMKPCKCQEEMIIFYLIFSIFFPGLIPMNRL